MTEEDARALLGASAGIDAAAGQEQAAAAAPHAAMVLVQDNAAAMEWVFVPELLAMLITTALPETEPMYTPEKNMAFAEKLAIVAAKRGWNVGSTPEIALGIAAVGFMAPAYMVYQHRKAVAAAVERAEREKGANAHLGASDGS
jgi:hypothetical protein